MERTVEALKIFGPSRISRVSGLSYVTLAKIANGTYEHRIKERTRGKIFDALLVCMKEDEERIEKLRVTLWGANRRFV